MPRILVVFHSRTGTCRQVAQRLASQGPWALGEVDAPAGGQGYVRCAVQALLRLQPRVAYSGPDPAAFDLVVLVAPVWCGTLAAPMRSFVAFHRRELPACALLSVMGGRGAEGAVRAVEQILGRTLRVTAALREAEIRGNHHHQVLAGFARRVAALIGPAVAARQPRAA